MPPPEPLTEDAVVLPAAMRDFIVAALGEASRALSDTHGLRATTHLLLRDGIQLTGENSFQIDHQDPLLLVNIIRRMLSR
jgi:hypothetical protein